MARKHRDSKMASWGASIPFGGSFTQRYENPPRRFRITKATLMKRVQWYLVEGWTFVECRIGDKQPVYLCSLNQGSVPLEVEFEESEDIIFRARGYRGVRLSGYYVSQNTETDLCEVKAAEDARSDYNALRPCKCMETCTNRVMVEKSETDKAVACNNIERDMTSQQQYPIVEGEEDNIKDHAVASMAKIDENLDGRSFCNLEDKEIDASIHVEEHVDSDLVLKEKIKPNNRKEEIIVGNTRDEVNDVYVSSSDLEVGNVQKLKKTKRNKESKSIEEDCRNRHLVGSAVVSLNFKRGYFKGGKCQCREDSWKIHRVTN